MGRGVRGRTPSILGPSMNLDRSWDALLNPGKATDFFSGVPPQPVVDPSHRGWSIGNAWTLAELSRTIYTGGDRGRYLRRAGLHEACFACVENVQCAIVRPGEHGMPPEHGMSPEHRYAVLVFRGTSGLRNWLTNLRAVPADWAPGGRVHRGFQRALGKVWDAVRDRLDSIDAPCLYTGHSLGGALATLAASLRPPVATYTFGAPRVGDREFVATLSSPLFRVVNDRDIVTTLPPRIGDRGFVHGGELRHIAADGSLHVDPIARPEVDEQPGDLVDDRRWFEPHAKLSDHAPVNYVARLADLLA